MISVNDIRNGMTLIVDGNIVQVLEFLHVKPGKGAAFVRTKLRNLRTGANIDYSFNAGVKVEQAEGEKCERCWMFSNTVGEDKENPTICHRCSEVLK